MEFDFQSKKNFHNWHLETAETVLSAFNSSENGLSWTEAKKRLLENGPNKLPEEKYAGVFKTFMLQFKSPLIYVLLFSTMIVSFIGEVTDGMIIIFVLAVNAIIGTFQEGKARKTLNSLKDFSKTKVVVVRDGLETEIEDENLVVGDIIVVRNGDKIGADSRIISSQALKVNESSLTGESEPVEKDSDSLHGDVPVPDRINMLYKGSLVVSGGGRAVVVETATNTVIGGISQKLKNIDSEMPLKKRMGDLSKMIGMTVLGAAIFVFVIGILRGIAIKDIFFTATAISVSLIPEGLPVVVTLILARGVYRMAKRNALVKNMQAVEALGQANILAVDKTGTITKNELMVEKVFVANREFTVLGNGYASKGDVLFDGKIINPSNHPELLFAGKSALFCADASVEFSLSGEVKVIGDPTEAALLVFGQKMGFKKDELENEEPKIFEIPFSFKHKLHTTLHKSSNGFFITTIGAPESILAQVKNIWTAEGIKEITEDDMRVINNKINKFSKMGLRVLCFATSITQDSTIDIENMRDLCLGGIFAMADVLREGISEYVRIARENGVKTVMITGDHVGTAEAIALQAGIFNPGDTVMLGTELDMLNNDDLDKKLDKVSVFARVLPEHKLTIVESYKRRGDIVGMTGDGVNDALSLSAAHLGITMGKGGTEVAKEAADIVLLDNNFRSILSAIEEGRSIYKTIKKVVLYLVSTSIGEFLTIAGALVAGLPLPISPSQILWLNLVTDGFMVVALAFEKNESLNGNTGYNGAIISKADALRVVIMGMVMMIGSLFLFTRAYEIGNPAMWTISLTVLAVFQWFNAWNCRSDRRSAFNKPFSNLYLLFGLIAAVFLHLLAIYNPSMQNLLHTSPLSLREWGTIVSVAFSVIIVEEARKLFIRLKNKNV